MKRQIVSVISKSVLGIVFFAGVIAAQGQTTEKGPDGDVVVKYLGAQDDMVIFTVAFKNTEGRRFTLIVKDQDNTQLFQQVYSDKNFEKRFRLPKTDRNKISFIIRDAGGQDIKQSFAINVNTHYVEDIAIRKID